MLKLHQQKFFAEMKAASNEDQDINVLAITWNMARKNQDVDFDVFLEKLDDHDVVLLTFQESKERASFIDRLTKYMSQHKFKVIG